MDNEIYKADSRFAFCPFCGKSNNLYIRKTATFIESLSGNSYGFSICCTNCYLIFGESNDQSQVFGTESELLLEWNKRFFKERK